jgi:hypothetical protein
MKEMEGIAYSNHKGPQDCFPSRFLTPTAQKTTFDLSEAILSLAPQTGCGPTQSAKANLEF